MPENMRYEIRTFDTVALDTENIKVVIHDILVQLSYNYLDRGYFP